MGAEVIHERGGEGRSGKGFREADRDSEGGLRGTGLSSVPPRGKQSPVGGQAAARVEPVAVAGACRPKPRSTSVGGAEPGRRGLGGEQQRGLVADGVGSGGEVHPPNGTTKPDWKRLETKSFLFSS
ncbi:unnamed protein product [Boreogadus saida]